MTNIRTRFSPSPTGLIHLGNIRAALFSCLYALKNHGVFILRIEDTDAARSEAIYVDRLQDDLRWLGLHWQEGPGVEGAYGPYWQSQRQSLYAKYYANLERQDLIYPCFCTDQALQLTRKMQLSRGQPPRYAGTCKKLTKAEIQDRLTQGHQAAWRFAVPKNKTIEFIDIIKGAQRFESNDIGDFIVRRADGTSPFLFCNAVDDALMKVTHVIRGEDHLANTPRQLMILESLDLRAPHYGHFSMIIGQDGAPLSKRNGSSSIEELRQQGYLPNAIVNYMSRLGHACDSQRLEDLDHLAMHFNLEKISHSPTRFDLAQLLFWQKTAVQALDLPTLWQWLGQAIKQSIPAEKQTLFIETIRDNIAFPQEVIIWVNRLFGGSLVLDEKEVMVLRETGEDFFLKTQMLVEKTGTDLSTLTHELKSALGVSGKKLFMPLRIALTGAVDGPQLAPMLTLMGQDKMISRLQDVLQLFQTTGAAC